MSAPSDNNGRLGEYEPCRVYQQDTNKGTAAWSNQDGVRLSSKLVRHLSPLCSSFLFLSASCLPGDWWGGGLWWSTMSMFLLSGLPVQALLSPPANGGRARPENATLIEGWAVLLRGFQTRGNGRALGWRCNLTSFPNASTLECGMMRRFHPSEGTDVCCDEGLLTTRKRLQSGNWQQAGSTPPSMPTNVPRCCSSRSVGYSFACQGKLMHKQRCHIRIGLPTESFHHGVVRLTTSAGGTWQYHHNMCS